MADPDDVDADADTEVAADVDDTVDIDGAALTDDP